MSLQREAPGASPRTLEGYIYLPSIKTTVIVYVDIIKLIFIFYLSSYLVFFFFPDWSGLWIKGLYVLYIPVPEHAEIPSTFYAF